MSGSLQVGTRARLYPGPKDGLIAQTRVLSLGDLKVLVFG
jgi:hypothetical protein